MDEERKKDVSPDEDLSIIKDKAEYLSSVERQVQDALKELKRVKEKYSPKEENKKSST